MFCANCGKEIDDNAVVCVHCGNTVQGSVPPVQQNGSVNQAEQQSLKSVNTNKLGIVGFSIGTGSIFVSAFLFLIGMPISMLSGTCLVAIVFCLFLPIAGLVFSALGVAKLKKYNHMNALAITGLVLSVFSFLLWLSFCISYIIRYGFILY